MKCTVRGPVLTCEFLSNILKIFWESNEYVNFIAAAIFWRSRQNLLKVPRKIFEKNLDVRKISKIF